MYTPDPWNGPALSRVYNGALGQAFNNAADRELLDRVLEWLPGCRYFVLANRTFVRAATQRFVAEGITQILDLGCGVVSREEMTHRVAHDGDPAVRVVYVDCDPVVIAHHRTFADQDDRLAAVHADICDVDAVLGSGAVDEVLDLTRPVGVLAAAVLHCVPDDDENAGAATVMRRYHDGLAQGSILAATHACGDDLRAEDVAQAIQLFAQAGIMLVSRSRQEFQNLLRPWRLDAGGVDVLRWRLGLDGVVDAHGHTAIAHSVRGGV